MKNILSFLIVSSIFATSCNSFVQLKTSNTVGVWHNTVSKNMGGYQISIFTELTIIRNGRADYSYILKQTKTDAMYGNQPKTESFRGKMEEGMNSNNEWTFIGGSYGERGAYIKVPDDRWNDYKPSEIIVSFAQGRGDSMIFIRK